MHGQFPAAASWASRAPRGDNIFGSFARRRSTERAKNPGLFRIIKAGDRNAPSTGPAARLCSATTKKNSPGNWTKSFRSFGAAVAAAALTLNVPAVVAQTAAPAPAAHSAALLLCCSCGVVSGGGLAPLPSRPPDRSSRASSRGTAKNLRAAGPRAASATTRTRSRWRTRRCLRHPRQGHEPEEQKSVTARVNDRGPTQADRIGDVSLAAANNSAW